MILIFVLTALVAVHGIDYRSQRSGYSITVGNSYAQPSYSPSYSYSDVGYGNQGYPNTGHGSNPSYSNTGYEPSPSYSNNGYSSSNSYGDGGYSQSNSGYSQSNSGYSQSNSGYSNSGYSNSNDGYGDNSYQTGYDNSGHNTGYGDSGYSPTSYGQSSNTRHGNSGYGNSQQSGYGNQQSGYSTYQPTSYGYQPRTRVITKKIYVPIVVKKKREKKKKTIAEYHGFYIPGGTQMFGKFKDFKSCQKACEITPTCFAGDFNPWVKKCYLHTNTTACSQMRAHKSIKHFKKIPCQLVETTRGLITPGAQLFNGIQQKGVKTLSDCIKKCATAGGGIAPNPATITSTPQLCFGIDYDFASHKCYFHVSSSICPAGPAAVTTPTNLVANPVVVNIVLCPLTK